jgi:hypothetical protein
VAALTYKCLCAHLWPYVSHLNGLLQAWSRKAWL